MSRPFRLLVLLSVAWVACASSSQTGIMAADWTPPKDSGIPPQRVTIAWEAHRASKGSMTFTLGRGGQRYVGTYRLIEKTLAEVEARPLYQIWDSSSFETWSAASDDPWFAADWDLDAWVRHYDGRVVVGLKGSGGGAARCQFTLADTHLGMPGGGKGECQVSDGGHLAVRF